MSEKNSKEQNHYKFKSLKTYTSTEWLAGSKKKYRQVFDQEETSYIYAELAFYNKQFDEEDWEAQINLKAFARPKDKRRKPRELCDVEISKRISKDKNVIYIREGWGMERKGSFWKEGTYYWEAYMDGEMVANTPFYVYDGGVVTTDHNPYMEISSVRLYEGANSDSNTEFPEYMTEFYDKETRFVWADLRATNKLDKDWKCELTFKFYNAARQLKGKTVELVDITKKNDQIRITSGWGSDHKGTWFPDTYTVEIVFMDVLIGVIPFKVGDHFVGGATQILKPQANPEGLIGLAPKPDETEQTLDEVLAGLDELIGLETIKTRIREYAQYLKFLNIRKEKGFEDSQPVSLHVVFAGNPGTGKTTVARMLGQIYHKLGLLSKGHVHEVDRADLVGEYIGQTAPKVRAAIEKARGGILFIDEAYSLARSGDDTKDFGREVIEMLVKEMSGEKGDLAVVVAGYPKEMETFMNSNPGLKSRITMRFDFSDYTPQELQAISSYWAEKKAVSFEPEAVNYLNKKLVEGYRSRDRTFGNARYALSLVSEAKMNLGLRVMKAEEPDSLSREDLSTIRLEDVQEIFEPHLRKMPNIPIDEESLHEALDELDSMIGLASVKSEMHELVKLVRFYREIDKDVLNRFSLHAVFTGNPGTGKTTVARILGKIYKALGILERGSLVEVDREALVSGFTGQTAIKTAELVDRAKGGVLFIDEAYSLVQGAGDSFGREAVDTLLKRMEDMRGELVVIAAGYPDNMRLFLEANPGLKSRFDRRFRFPDYTAEELLEIAEAMFESEGTRLNEEATDCLSSYFRYLHKTKSKYFGNARAVRKVVEKAIKLQHLRLAALDPKERTPDMLKEITFADVAEFKPGNDSLMEGGTQGRVGFH
ncbi:AAA family ATPase [Pontibacter sp. G13]|uniref:AAA family ATPase n=1 Tax=Pontibacter sp. G13 TaxID=3074898 RepID=UPI002889D5E2|nr:AAA family ATPase [Pontibacter sp. G13]WNJ16225.1 AAA family ATPase [Pontibacter sp. G13]